MHVYLPRCSVYCCMDNMDTGLVGFWFIATRWLWLVESIPFALNVRHTAEEQSHWLYLVLFIIKSWWYESLMYERWFPCPYIIFFLTYFKMLIVEGRTIKKSMPKELFSHLSKFLKCFSVANCVSQPIGNYNNISFAFHLMVFWIDLISNK